MSSTLAYDLDHLVKRNCAKLQRQKANIAVASEELQLLKEDIFTASDELQQLNAYKERTQLEVDELEQQVQSNYKDRQSYYKE